MSGSTLLVPADFSDCSPEVVRHAAQLAHEMGGKLALVHVVELPKGVAGDTQIHPRNGGPAVGAAAFLEAEARETLAHYATAVRDEMGDVEVLTLVEHGPVVDRILAAAEEVGARMIVMGTHGRSGLSRVVLGSVAEHVLRASDVPVLTVRTQHKPTCEARSCAWCSSHVSWAESRVRAEADG